MKKLIFIFAIFILSSCAANQNYSCHWNEKYTPAAEWKFKKHAEWINIQNCNKNSKEFVKLQKKYRKERNKKMKKYCR